MENKKTVIFEFDTEEQARDFFDSFCSEASYEDGDTKKYKKANLAAKGVSSLMDLTETYHVSTVDATDTNPYSIKCDDQRIYDTVSS